MPTYTYECSEHGRFDYLYLTMDDEKTKLAPCPECEKDSPKVFASSGSFILSGSGYYSTDSRGGSSSTKVSTNYGKSRPVSRKS